MEYIPSYLLSPPYNNYQNENQFDFNQPYDPNQNREILYTFQHIFGQEHIEDEDNETNKNDVSKSNKNQDDQLNDNNIKNIELKGQNIGKPNEFNMNFAGNLKTRATSKIIGNKTKRSDWTFNEIGNKKQQGRKSKYETEKGEHTKFTEDNLMRKIKSHFLEYIHNLLNNSFKNKNMQFLRLFSKINENLKKDYNMELMIKTIKELYENSPISKKYRRQQVENSDINKKIIQQIYAERNLGNLENEVIKILNSTYKDLLIEFRNKHFNEFLDDIEKEEITKGETEENIQKYKKEIGKLCLNYEKWFEKKNGRNRNKE